MKALISDIYIAPDRARRDMGDLKELMRSIQTLGLLHPVVVTPDHETEAAWRLIAGQRRLAASAALGLADVPITVIYDMSDISELSAERDENTCRKDLTPSEMVGLAVEIERLERPQAKARVAATQFQNGKSPGPVGANGAALGETRQIVAKAVGVGQTKLSQARELVDLAKHATDPELQALAKAAVAEMDETGVVETAWKRLDSAGWLRCSVCKERKRRDEFAGGGPASRGGKTWECKVCASHRHQTITTPRRRAGRNGTDDVEPTLEPKAPEAPSKDPRVRRKRERMEQVEKLWQQGFRYDEIASKLSVHRTTVQADVRDLGLSGKRRNGSSQSVIETLDRVTQGMADIAGVVLDHKRRTRLDVEDIVIDDDMAKEWESRLAFVGSTVRFIREIAKAKGNPSE